MKRRKEATEYWINLITDLKKGNQNIAFYTKYLNNLSDKAFDDLVDLCDTGNKILPYYAPNITEPDLDVADCIRVGKKLKLNFFQRYIKTSPSTGVRRLTPKRYPVLLVPWRRLSQHVSIKKSVAEDTKHIDNLSGQVIGASKTAKMSNPELQVLDAKNLHHGIYELAGVKGGNVKGLKLAQRDIINHGTFSLEDIKNSGHRAKSLDTANAILRGMLYDSNL